MLNGIPRQIWMGKLSFTTYTPVSEAPGQPVTSYKANYQSELHYFAKDLRKIVRNYIFANREINDLLDVGHDNPGKLPNAAKLT